MDYEVFLLSRIRERYVATGDNRRAVAEGLQASLNRVLPQADFESDEKRAAAAV